MKTFKDFLTEGPDDPDWMKMGDPSGLSTSERFRANQLERPEPTAQEVGAKAREQGEKIKQRAASMRQGYEQGPAINDVKAVLERLQKLEDEVDSLAGEIHAMEPGDISRELDGMRQRMADLVSTLNKAWTHLAVGGKPYRGKE